MKNRFVGRVAIQLKGEVSIEFADVRGKTEHGFLSNVCFVVNEILNYYVKEYGEDCLYRFGYRGDLREKVFEVLDANARGRKALMMCEQREG